MPTLAKIPMWSCAAAVFLLIGCGEQKQAAVVPVPVISVAQQNREIAERLQVQTAANEKKSTEEGETAERQRLINLLRAPVGRWMDVFQQLPGKNTAEVGVFIAQMQAIQSEMAAVPVSSCTEPKRADIIHGMEALAALLGEFVTTKGEVGADFPTRLGEAFMNVERPANTLTTCA